MGGLGGVELGAWMLSQSRVVHLLHERVGDQELGDPGGALSLALHAQGHGLQASQRQPAVEGRQPRPLRILAAHQSEA